MFCPGGENKEGSGIADGWLGKGGIRVERERGVELEKSVETRFGIRGEESAESMKMSWY